MQSQTTAPSLFGSTLGGSTNTLTASAIGQGGAQGTLMASIAEPVSANLPIFSMLPPGPRAVTLEQPKKKPGFFSDVPTRSPVPRLQLGYSPASSKLRGFASTSVAPGTPAGLNGSISLTSGKPNALSLSKASKTGLGPEAFLSGSTSSPSLGSGTRHSVKKLVLDKKVDPSDLFTKSTAVNGKVTFSPALGVAAREKEAANAGLPGLRASESPAPTARAQAPRTPNRFTAQPTAEQPSSPTKDHGASSTGKEGPAELQEGDYWMKPSLEELRRAGHEELVAVKGLVVGRVGYGQITFLEPVDLTNVPKLAALLGELVRFDDKECSVYPDSDDAEKPPPGVGLNVRARIELVRCWPLDKASREPIKDPNHPMAVRHLKRLRSMKHTQFGNFDWEEGKWTFTVDHF